MFYHFLIYTCHCNAATTLQKIKEEMMECRRKKTTDVNNTPLLNIPETTSNYAKYQDGLVSDDFK